MDDMTSRVERTLSALFDMGRESGIVERFIHNDRVKFGIRSDLFGLFDIVSMSYESGIVGVQVCGGSDAAAHVRKITIDKRKHAAMWLRCGGKIELWIWRKVNHETRKGLKVWRPKIKRITIEDLNEDLLFSKKSA